MEAIIYNRKGEASGKLKLAAEVFGLRWNSDLVHQVMTSMASNARENVAHTKGRGDVSGGGKKPWRQKGTGRARHGSTRSPIWVGGGVAHGPTKERNFDKKINKKMLTKALFTVLSRKVKDNEVMFIDELAFAGPKAGEAKRSMDALAQVKGFDKLNYKTGKRAFVALPLKDDNALKSFRNLKSVKVEEIRNISPADLLTYKYVLIVKPEESIKILSARQK